MCADMSFAHIWVPSLTFPNLTQLGQIVITDSDIGEVQLPKLSSLMSRMSSNSL